MYTYSFIGTGNIAEAIIAGLLATGNVTAECILCCDISENRLQSIAERFPQIATTTQLQDAAHGQVIVLSTKPGQIVAVAQELASHLLPTSLIVSVAAGITLGTLSQALPTYRIIRVMPNTPALVQAGASCFSANEHADNDDRAAVATMLRAIGLAYEVEEYQLDAVTALSGSGPGYICLVVEALSDAGVKLGLPRQLAQMLAAQTVYGTGKLIIESGEHPALLREKVTSPGGTTITGIAALEAAGVRSAFITAAEAAYARSKELGRN